MKTYKDIYKFPLHQDKYSGWVWDADDNFVFQFEYKGDATRAQMLDVINGEDLFTNPDLSFKHTEGIITSNLGEDMIMIRGWGNLTGTGGHNLHPNDAINVQDTFAEYIVERLNKR